MLEGVGIDKRILHTPKCMYIEIELEIKIKIHYLLSNKFIYQNSINKV